MPLQRSDKRPDRVEIAPEQLHEAILRAEADLIYWHFQSITKESGTQVRVIGWVWHFKHIENWQYHSHPHITVFPSSIGIILTLISVDLRTELGQQQMDEHFFGIIISCFDEQSQKVCDDW